jgi:protein-tyrosine phosphatase
MQILVHCMAGVSRSVSLVIAYLIKHKDMNYEAAYTLVKSRRKIVR